MPRMSASGEIVDPAADAVAANRANWDDRAEVHVGSDFYDVDGFVNDRSAVSPYVRRDLDVLAPHLDEGTIRGRSLLHLQCHIGIDTISWYRLGARDVHGVDFSPNSLRHASAIADRCDAEVTFVEAENRSTRTPARTPTAAKDASATRRTTSGLTT